MVDIPIELLWRAWPAGYLAKRGVLTVGGWTCAGPVVRPQYSLIRSGPIEGTAWTAMSCTSELITTDPQDPNDSGRHNRARGELLPNVDPADTATWACLMVDLAEAVTARYKAEGLSLLIDGCFGLTFTSPTLHGDYWRIIDALNRSVTWQIAQNRTLNPALALVRCRIYEREREPGSKETP